MPNPEFIWTERVKKHLVGRTIVKVLYLPRKYAKKLDWLERPIVLRLDDGSYIYPMRDDEGNDGGALATGYDDIPTIPTI